MYWVAHQLSQGKSDMSGLEKDDEALKADQMIRNFTDMGVAPLVDSEDWLKGNSKVNSVYVSEIFNTNNGLQELKVEEV